MRILHNIDESWLPLFSSLLYQKDMYEFIENLRDIPHQPDYDSIMKVFEMPVRRIKVVILGQEPYSMPGLSTGLAYAVKEGTKTPKILNNIRKEIVNTVPWSLEKMGDWGTLEKLQSQGVFLLNKALTVKTGSAGSHNKLWKKFTDTVISFISEENPCIWVFWGDSLIRTKIKIKNPFIVEGYDRQTIEELPIDPEFNYILEGQHPIKGEGFSNDAFYNINKILEKRSLDTITW